MPRKYPYYSLGWQCRRCSLVYYGYTQADRPAHCRNCFCGSPAADLVEFDALELDELRETLIWSELDTREPRSVDVLALRTGLDRADVVRSLFILTNLSLLESMLRGVLRRAQAEHADPFEAAAAARKEANDHAD